MPLPSPASSRNPAAASEIVALRHQVDEHFSGNGEVKLGVEVFDPMFH